MESLTKRPVCKVFGVGLNKTGTTTLGNCLKLLGYRHQSHSEEFTELYSQGQIARLMEVAKHFDSLEDWPWPLLYKELAAQFPDSKFILTMRRSDSVWLKSLITHSYKLPPNENYHNLVYGYKYPLGHKKYHLDFYNNHNSAVIEYFRSQPERLLVLNWEKGEGWPELCNFLNVDIPNVPLPHSGATKDWLVPRSRILFNYVSAIKEVRAQKSSLATPVVQSKVKT